MLGPRGRNVVGDDDEEDGLTLLGVDSIPTAGATYNDAKTVAAVQAALNARNYGPLVVDGIFGPKTKAAIKKMQATLGLDQTGKIDEGVISALKVTPGVLPPGVSIQSAAAVQAQVALDAATAAEHATTPADVQAAAQAAVDAAPAQPPQLKQAAQAALAKAKAATTPAQVKAAASDVQDAAMDVHQATKPNWLTLPAWDGGMARWQVGLIGLGVLTGIGALAIGLSGAPARGSAEWSARESERVRGRIDKWRHRAGLPAHKWSNE